MNFLMSVAVIGAFVLGEFEEGAMVIFLFAVANLLEAHSVDRSTRAIRNLMETSPETAQVRRDGVEYEIGLEDIQVGDVVLVRPGKRIPVDGVVDEGRSAVDESSITGESRPVRKESGSEVYAGAINISGLLVLRALRMASDSTIARLNRLVEEAREQKAPIEQFVDTFSRYYTPLVVAGAVLVAALPPVVFAEAWEPWFYRSLVLLVIACPCALVISTPVTMVSGLTRAARSGVLLKGSAFLEAVSRVKVFAFDKTGTITQANPSVLEVVTLTSGSDTDLLRIAASVEAHVQHPIAAAIVAHALSRNISLDPVESLEEISGRGVKGVLNGVTYYVGSHALLESVGLCDSKVHELLDRIEKDGQTAVLVGAESGILGVFTVSDTIRPETYAALKELQVRFGRKLAMLTGDNHRTAAAVAKRLGISDVRAELLPGEKLESIRDLRKTHGTVAMVGDGVNDAPSLALATVGIAVGTGGNDIALEAADIALVSDNLSKIPYLVRLSRFALSVSKQNIALAIGIKAAFLTLAIHGLATLWMAVFADMGTSLLVILNGLRVLRTRDADRGAPE